MIAIRSLRQSFTYEVGAEIVFENEEKYREFLEAEKKRIEGRLTELDKPKVDTENPSLSSEDGHRYLDLYANGDKVGVELFAEICGNYDYSFDMTVVFKNTHNGKLAWAHDSGCSCPSPFEDYKSWNDLEKLPETFQELSAQVMAIRDRNSTDKLDFLRKVSQELGI